MKTPLAERPVFLKSPRRVEALVTLLQIALQAYQVLERRYRQTVPAEAPTDGTLGKDPRTPGPFLRPRSGANSMIVSRVELGEIQSMRDVYRHEMHCQIIFDSVHVRPGWTHEYLITEGESKLGYGSVAVAGPRQ